MGRRVLPYRLKTGRPVVSSRRIANVRRIELAGDAVLGAEERDELHIRRGVQQLSGANAVAIAARVIGDQPDAPPGKLAKSVAHEHVNSWKDGCRHAAA